MTPIETHQRCAICRYRDDERSKEACAEAAYLMRELRKAVAESEGRAQRHGHTPIPLEVSVNCPMFYATHRRSA